MIRWLILVFFFFSNNKKKGPQRIPVDPDQRWRGLFRHAHHRELPGIPPSKSTSSLLFLFIKKKKKRVKGNSGFDSVDASQRGNTHKTKEKQYKKGRFFCLRLVSFPANKRRARLGRSYTHTHTHTNTNSEEGKGRRKKTRWRRESPSRVPQIRFVTRPSVRLCVRAFPNDQVAVGGTREREKKKKRERERERDREKPAGCRRRRLIADR